MDEKRQPPPSYTATDQTLAPVYSQQPMMQPVQNLQQPTVVYAPQAAFGPRPTRAPCPNCQQVVMTKVTSVATGKTHMIAVLLGCCFCWVPYCVDECQAQNHHCPSCNIFMGSYNT